MRVILAGLVAAGMFAGAARAEDAAKPAVPDFVPVVVDQGNFQKVMSYLNGLTFKDAAPVVGWLNDLEAKAKAQWEADHAPKKDEPPK